MRKLNKVGNISIYENEDQYRAIMHFEDVKTAIQLPVHIRFEDLEGNGLTVFDAIEDLYTKMELING